MATRIRVVRVTKAEEKFLREVRRMAAAGDVHAAYAKVKARLRFLEAEADAARAEIARLDRLIEADQLRELEESGVPVIGRGS